MQISALKSSVPMSSIPSTLSDGIVCAPSSPLVNVVRACRKIAASDATVLLTGETGTGKEVFARMVHSHSVRSKRAFVPVNCAAIPDALLESELFGYVRGAFTGAAVSRRGRVAMAEGGTLFLDEVGDLPLPLQVKLLRLLQNHTYEPVGSSESVTGDFRLVAATNRDLSEDVRAGRFRRDLYYRLHVCPVVLPPLRERPQDIAPLFFHFWQSHGETRPISPAVVRQLEGYSWPGNVRELENLAERLSVCAESNTIVPSDLPAPFFGNGSIQDVFLCGPGSDAPQNAGELIDLAQADSPVDTGELVIGAMAEVPAPELPAADAVAPHLPAVPVASAPRASVTPQPELRLPIDLPKLLRETEESYIRMALDQSGGNKKEAARLLGMGRTTLVEKLRRKAAAAPDKVEAED